MSNKSYLARRARLGAVALMFAFACSLLVFVAPARAASDESDVRGAIESAFAQLRTGNYDALYDVLPSASQRRLSRERFTRALERTKNMYELERLEIGAVHVAGDLAMADSVVYGRARAPFEGEGKIVVRQYLVREAGRWRVTTGDRAAISPLLTANPAFAKRYPPTQPRLYVKRDGRWVDIRTMFKDARQQATKRSG
ncbi:MAG: hypothetical protein DMF64_17090 [Acidobacteria bacterium]|nr:MAG: hypothetical protein DMF64_17090 [Acidobacteriota bacterium]